LLIGLKSNSIHKPFGWGDNLWGEELYTFSDLNVQWNGVYRGNPWPTNSKLVYRGQFKKYNGDIVRLTGFIIIVR
tara:strand:+ start:5255 stop:5479 length:225 start_codon:yes stop_codon:yes gene_type:complete